jgi:hypothetical protein
VLHVHHQHLGRLPLPQHHLHILLQIHIPNQSRTSLRDVS